MKTNLFAALIILISAASAEGQQASREIVGAHPVRSIEMAVLAERFADAVTVPQSRTDGRITFVAAEGGLLEGGQSVAGEKPPSAAIMAETLTGVLDAQGYRSVQPGGAPEVLITYHWGILRAELDANTIYADTNSMARLSLIAPAQEVRRIQNEIVTRNFVVTPLDTLGLPGNREVIELASGPRYFVILSAYDHRAFTRGEAALLWRVKLSAYDNTGSMAEVLPALLRGSAPHLGQQYAKAQKVTVPLLDNARVTSASERREGPPGYKSEFLERMLVRERAQITGENLGVLRDNNQAARINPRHAITISAVALQTEAVLRHPRPSPESPAFYLACDAGAVGLLAGENPPKSEVVARSLAAALRKQGYEPAGSAKPPTVLLVYHWGAEASLIEGGQGDRDGVPATMFHNVVVVSAYDYGDLLLRQRTLLWRTKLMAPQSGKMNEVLPVLIVGGAGFLGRNFQQIQQVIVPRNRFAGEQSTDDAAQDSAYQSGLGKLEGEVLRDVIAWERDGFYRLQEGSSALILDTEGKPFGLPSALAKRITAYLQRKGDLQNALASSIKALPAGADSKMTIDAFSKQNAATIMALVREREAIRAGLAQFTARRPRHADDEPLAAILRAFAVDTRTEEIPPVPAGG